MRDRETLRKGDIVAGVLLIVFGLSAIYGASQMPIQASYGGVKNIWYVSPALFPFIISFFIVVLGVISLVNAVRELGKEKVRAFFEKVIEGIKKHERLEPKVYRASGIVALLVLYIFLFLPRVDFFLSSFMMLTIFISAYYYDVDVLTRKMLSYFFIGSAAFAVYFIIGLDSVVNGIFVYGTDVILLLYIIGYIVYARMLAGGDKELKKKFRISLTTGFLVPFLLCPIFKYGLLIPLPKDGGIIRIMDFVRYTVF